MAKSLTKNKEYKYMNLFGEPEEDPAYLNKQIITYIGNKRELLDQIDVATNRVKQRLGKKKLRILDAFSGSGIVSRNFKRHATYLASIDIEDYATVIANCYLRNRNTIDESQLKDIVCNLNSRVDKEKLPVGFIQGLYAPKCENHITKQDRVFYTIQNARRLDNYRRMINGVSDEYKTLLLGPLLSKASVHANTSGVFKGFHKNRHKKIGCFGGTNGDALKRILGEILLEIPVLSRFECEVEVINGDANICARQLRNLDLAYFDPPYNQHPYGSNYFMLNLIVSYKRPNKISHVSGIPSDWKRSDYNKPSLAFGRFFDLLKSTNASFLLVSFNNEGFISPSDMISMLEELGKVDELRIKYNTFRGCRNLKNRNTHVTEHLYLVERG